jgi:hypothetical protein
MGNLMVSNLISENMTFRSNILLFGIFVLIKVLFSGCNTTNHTISESKMNVAALDIEVDKLGNYYLIDNENNIVKYNKNRKPVYSYSNNQFGNPAMIDVINPHKILVFYKQQQTLVFLDNTLSEISIISLNPNSFYSSAGMANDGNIWLFDSYYYKLVKIDMNGVLIDESFPVEEIGSAKIHDSKIVERENYVLIVDMDDNVFLYTNLGYFIRKIHLSGIVKPTVLNKKIYYFNRIKNTYSVYDLKYKEEDIIFEFDNIKPLLVLYENNRFYVLADNKVTVIPLRNELLH